jgi:hypothetical protein
MLELSAAPGTWPSCYRGIRERERLDSTGIWFCERLMEIRLVLSGNVYNL